MVAKKQRIKLASDAPLVPSGMSAFADILYTAEPVLPPPRATLSAAPGVPSMAVWSKPRSAPVYGYREDQCPVLGWRCRYVGHDSHPTPLEVATSSLDPTMLKNVAECATPEIFAILVNRVDLAGTLICAAAKSAGLAATKLFDEPFSEEEADQVASQLLKRESLTSQMLDILCASNVSDEMLLEVCAHLSMNPRTLAYVGASLATGGSSADYRVEVVRIATGLWGRSAWALRSAALNNKAISGDTSYLKSSNNTLTVQGAVRRAKRAAKSPNAAVVVETLETLALEWHGTADELCQMAGMLAE